MHISDFFKYCPNCKTSLFKKDNFFSCQNCNFYFYHNPIPTNGLIIYNKNKEIFLVKRKFNPKKNYWDIAGGFVNLSENIEESIKREIKEELDIEINTKKLKYLTSTTDKYRYKKITHYTLCFVFIYKIEENLINKIKPKDDISEVKWFKKENIPWGKIAFEGIKMSLKLFLTSF